MKGVFISYRRADSQGWAGRIQEGLRARFPEMPLFFDLDTIAPGEDFVEAIQRALEGSAALLALIGPHWLDCANAAGQRRIDDPEDTLRLELATALSRELLVIPVLVGGARMPPARSLPSQLAALARRNAHELTDRRWQYDFDRLVAAIARAAGVSPREGARAGEAPAVVVARRLTLEESEAGDISGYKVRGSGARPPGPTDVATQATIKRSKIGDITGVKHESSNDPD